MARNEKEWAEEIIAQLPQSARDQLAAFPPGYRMAVSPGRIGINSETGLMKVEF